MNFFESFPLTYYTLDNKKTVQIIRDITRRVSIVPKSMDNLTMFEEVDVDDGSPPWIIADIYYNDPELYWVILIVNEITDPRFQWPMSYKSMVQYVEGKYSNRDGHHHYEDSNENVINGRLYLRTHHSLVNISIGDVLKNNNGEGIATVTEKLKNPDRLRIITSHGGFMHLDSVSVVGKDISFQLIETEPEPGCFPVTNYLHESRLNDARRRIKVLKPIYLDRFINDFRTILDK